MKIRIITNTFGEYLRQTIAVDSWRILKNKYPDIIEIVDYQFVDEKETYDIKYKDLDTRFELGYSSYDFLDNPSKKLPLVSAILARGAIDLTDEDYIIFTNSDVIIMPILIEELLEKKYKAKAYSRLDIEPINSINDVIQQNIKPVRWEIAGFDTFVMNVGWYNQYEELFQGYFLGKHLWDVTYAGICKIFGDNQPLGNSYIPHTFHIHHGQDAVMKWSPEHDHNTKINKDNPLDSLLANIMFMHLKSNLIRRTPWGAVLVPKEDEKKVENAFFDILNIHTVNKLI
jgi:hypothetical protein